MELYGSFLVVREGAHIVGLAISRYFWTGTGPGQEPVCPCQVHYILNTPDYTGLTVVRNALHEAFDLFDEVLLSALKSPLLIDYVLWMNWCIDIVLIGKIFYTYFSLIFILCGVMLFLAIVGILISSEFSSYQKSLTYKQVEIEHKQVVAEQISKLYKDSTGPEQVNEVKGKKEVKGENDRNT
jgi:hypothetical protein